MRNNTNISTNKLLLRTMGIFMLLIGVSACEWLGMGNAQTDARPIARIGDSYLYDTDLGSIVPKGTSAADSTEMINFHIDSWIRQKLLLLQTDQLPLDVQVNINRQVSQYKESLVAYQLERQLLHDNPDTVVTDQQVTEYYESHKDGFITKDNVLLARYVILNNEAPRIDSVKHWLTQEEVDEAVLEDYCYQFATDFIASPTWFQWNILLNEIPIASDDPKAFLEGRKFYRTKDAVNTYMIQIVDYGLQGETAPLDYVSEDIKKVILNKNRLQYIDKFKDQLYQKALQNGQIETYE